MLSILMKYRSVGHFFFYLDTHRSFALFLNYIFFKNAFIILFVILSLFHKLVLIKAEIFGNERF